ncbi:excalibur calcium-binding domain-containing protein [Sporosarcina sp. FSL K6-1508]|uniref:excalibur calcium-binding domain-containing protein n=1 Tax=Sporosarcina sp. FSL K6-1508 TaxID=2921553 RepID=UPI0030FC6F27
MEVISSIGSLVFFFSLVYLVYHLIRKRKNPVRILPKKKFYTALIGGFALVGISSSLSDTSVQDALDEALETNIALVAENKELKSTNAKLQESNDVVNKELNDLTKKLSDSDKLDKELKVQQAVHKKNTEAFEKEIAELKATNTTLTAEVESSKNQEASKSATSTASSSGGSSGSSSSAGTSQQSANVYYKNCTAVRDAGADPVYRGDPGYAKHLDRDGDGVGCE